MEDEEIQLSGEVLVQVHDLNGMVMFEERHNAIYRWAKLGIAQMCFLNTGSPNSTWKVNRLVTGRNGTDNISRADDGSLGSAALADKSWTTTELALPTFANTVAPLAPGGVVTFTATVAPGENNGQNMCEAGLVFESGGVGGATTPLFSRVTHGNIAKTDTISVTYTWTVNVT